MLFRSKLQAEFQEENLWLQINYNFAWSYVAKPSVFQKGTTQITDPLDSPACSLISTMAG